jgi:type II secretory pathway component PulK
MTQPKRIRRRGFALVFVVVILMLCSALMVSITTQIAAAHKLIDRRENRQQALWLARSGVELAAAHLLRDPKYKGETTELMPLGRVHVTVLPEKKTGVLQITSEARFPTNVRDPAVQVVTRSYRRVVDGTTVRLERVW